MLILADTGILVRLLDRTDPQHLDICNAARIIRQRGDRCVISPQNAAEFWTVVLGRGLLAELRERLHPYRSAPSPTNAVRQLS